jgi:hypothetical protein
MEVNMKKIFIFIVVVSILLSGFGIFRMINKELSKDEFVALMNSFEQVSNVKLEGGVTKYIKDEYMLSIREDGLYTWGNSKTGECISYFPNEKIYAFVDYAHSDSNDFEKAKYTFIRI